MSENIPKLSETKSQHYVPRMLLKNFTDDGTNLDIFVIKRRQHLKRKSIKEQCAKDYYYGSDGQLEEGFADLETKTGSILFRLINEEHPALSEEEVFTLRTFIHFQLHRTVAAAADWQRDMGAMMKKFAQKVMRADNPVMAAKVGDDFEVVFNNPQLHALKATLSMLPALMDLPFRLLRSQRGKQFITSDNPIVLYNQFSENHPFFSRMTNTTGLASKGIQVFFPLSPSLCLALYDPTTYSYGTEDDPNCYLGSRDVTQINRLQVMNAHRCVFLHPSNKDVEKIASFAKDFRPNEDKKANLKEYSVVGDEKRKSESLLLISKSAIKIGAKFSFVQIIDKNLYKNYRHTILPPRSKELVDAINTSEKFFQEKFKESKLKHEMATSEE